MAKHHGYRNVTEMIHAYNDEEHIREGYPNPNAPKVDSDIVSYLNHEFRDKRRVDIKVVLIDHREVVHCSPLPPVASGPVQNPPIDIPIFPIIPIGRRGDPEPRPETPPSQEPPEIIPPAEKSPLLRPPVETISPTDIPPTVEPIITPELKPKHVRPGIKRAKDAQFKNGPATPIITREMSNARSQKQPLPENYSSKGLGRGTAKGNDRGKMTRKGR